MENVRIGLMMLCAVLDGLALFAGFGTGEALRGTAAQAPMEMPLGVVMVAIFACMAIVGEAYSSRVLIHISASVATAWRALASAVLALIVLAFLMGGSAAISRLALGYAVIVSLGLLGLVRFVVAMICRLFNRGKLSREIVISDQPGTAFPPDMQIIDPATLGFVADVGDPHSMNRITDLVAGSDRVILHCYGESRAAWITALKAAGVSCETTVPSHLLQSAVGIGRFGSFDTLVISRGPLSLGSRMIKRLFDLSLTVPILVFVTPMLLAIALLIRLESPGPALFAQQRIGQGNRPFKIYKFRTMQVTDADPAGVRSVVRGDSRLTRLGAFLRRSSIDELPQLFNVIIGNMSLVGPRPHAPGSRAGEQLFWEVSDRYWMRHALKPGITGLAQIKGYRGATATHADLEERLRYDLEYLQNWSLRNDIAILLATVRVVTHANAY